MLFSFEFPFSITPMFFTLMRTGEREVILTENLNDSVPNLAADMQKLKYILDS